MEEALPDHRVEGCGDCTWLEAVAGIGRGRGLMMTDIE